MDFLVSTIKLLGFPLAVLGAYLAYMQYSRQRKYLALKDFQLFYPRYLEIRHKLNSVDMDFKNPASKDVDEFILSSQELLMLSKYLIEYTKFSNNPIQNQLIKVALDVENIHLSASYLEDLLSNRGIIKQVEKFLPKLEEMYEELNLSENVKFDLSKKSSEIKENYKNLLRKDLDTSNKAHLRGNIIFSIAELQGTAGTMLGIVEYAKKRVELEVEPLWKSISKDMDQLNSLQHIIFETKEVNSLFLEAYKKVLKGIPDKEIQSRVGLLMGIKKRGG